jgi:hypothetical protein
VVAGGVSCCPFNVAVNSIFSGGGLLSSFLQEIRLVAVTNEIKQTLTLRIELMGILMCIINVLG